MWPGVVADDGKQFSRCACGFSPAFGRAVARGARGFDAGTKVPAYLIKAAAGGTQTQG
jgi:hypothetical protein